MIAIYDEIHCEETDLFETFERAISELRQRAGTPWDEAPNRAPCTSWKTCGRKYVVVEYDISSQTPWERVRYVTVMNISAKGVEWIDGFEEAWQMMGGA
jgi:hypothetical protein